MFPNKDIYFIITRKCNYNCSFCIRKNLEDIQTDMSFLRAERVMTKLSALLSLSTIFITGGEPLLHPNCLSFVKKAMSLFKVVVLTSNGSFSSEQEQQLVPLLAKNLWLQLSIDGTAKVQDKLRGCGAYNKVVEKLTRLQPYAKHLVLSSTVGNTNLHDIKNLAQELNKYHFYRWKITEELVIDPFKTSVVDIQDWNKMVDEVLPLCNFSVRVQKFFDFSLMDQFLKKYNPQKHQLITKCGSGTKSFSINPDFSVIACTCLDEPVGNIDTESIEQLLTKLESYCNKDPAKESVCFSCKYKEICKGGCPGYSKKIFGQFNKGDIRCPLVKKNYYAKR